MVGDFVVHVSAKDVIGVPSSSALLTLVRSAAARAGINYEQAAVVSIANSDGVELLHYEKTKGWRELAPFGSSSMVPLLYLLSFQTRGGEIVTVAVEVEIAALVAERMRQARSGLDRPPED